MSRRSILTDWFSPTNRKKRSRNCIWSQNSDVVVIYYDIEHRTSTSSHKTRKGWEFWQWKRHFLHCSLKRHSTDGWRDLHPTSVFFFQFLQDYGFLEYFLTLVEPLLKRSDRSLSSSWSLLWFFSTLTKSMCCQRRNPSGFLTIANFSPLSPFPNIIFFKNQGFFFYIQNTSINN